MINLASLIERIANKTSPTGTGPMAKVLGKAGVATGGQFAELVRLAAAKNGGLPGAPGTTMTGPASDVRALMTKTGDNNVVPFMPPARKAGQMADATLTPAANDAAKATAAPTAVKTAVAKVTTVAATATAALAKATTAAAATKTVQGAILDKQTSQGDTAENVEAAAPATTRKKPKTGKAKTAAAAAPASANAALAASDVVLQAQQLTNRAGKAAGTTTDDTKSAGAKVGQLVSSSSAQPSATRAALPTAPATASTETSAVSQLNAPAPHQAKTSTVIQQASASATDSKASASKTGTTLQANATGQPTPSGQGAAMTNGQNGGTDTGAQPRQDGQIDKVAKASDGTKQRATSAEIAGILQSLPPGIQSQLGVSSHAAVPLNGSGAAPIMAHSTADQLSGQVIDMSVSGQWIDRMAHEISALAQGAGHSQFQLSPANLGKIQIDLWQADSTTNIRMLTETTDAAQRLDQGKHMLHADARLASLQLGTISIEKAATSQDQSAAQRQAGNMGGQPQRQDNGQAQSQGQAGGNRANGWSAATPARDSAQPSDNQPTDGNARRRWRFA